jgi:hypothetical protein
VKTTNSLFLKTSAKDLKIDSYEELHKLLSKESLIKIIENIAKK